MSTSYRQRQRRRQAAAASKKEEEARESQECNVFDKVNGLRVALCFGGCRVLGCIIAVVFMVCE
eukprot:scaffold23656_cov75-Skeletonema_dohrnii-CCMP3373.AAC.2